ncbi:SURF1 family protein [Legionella gresilensis]|uniref:SURF1 family protein n=1 Tax=Legionella gresilensis TaxID=91823 RepID=UPI001040E651|nr:SURF1 family protein [Legionella gresilensis]
MASLTCFYRRFTFNWLWIIGVIFLSSFFIYLGIWQLNRADEKKNMLIREEYLSAKAPIKWQTNIKPQQYQQITVQGQYLPQTFLLDNQHHEHQFGYNVLTPLLLSDGKVILIDRGWIKGDLDRRKLPTITSLNKSLQLLGQVYYPSSKNWVLGQILEKKTPNLAVIEQIDSVKISQFLHKSVYPFIIRLNKLEKDGYIREWAIISMPPGRHKAYALQWFAMALVIWLIFIGLSLKKTNE